MQQKYANNMQTICRICISLRIGILCIYMLSSTLLMPVLRESARPGVSKRSPFASASQRPGRQATPVLRVAYGNARRSRTGRPPGRPDAMARDSQAPRSAKPFDSEAPLQVDLRQANFNLKTGRAGQWARREPLAVSRPRRLRSRAQPAVAGDSDGPHRDIGCDPTQSSCSESCGPCD